jgi:hypothetical protein
MLDFVNQIVTKYAMYCIYDYDGTFVEISPALLRVSNAKSKADIIGTTGRQGQFNVPPDFSPLAIGSKSPDDSPESTVFWYVDSDDLIRPYIKTLVVDDEKKLIFENVIPHYADITRVLDRYSADEDKYISSNGSTFSRAVINTVMFYARGYTYDKISRLLDVSPKTVSNRLDRFIKDTDFRSTKELSLYIGMAFRGASPSYFPHNQLT